MANRTTSAGVNTNKAVDGWRYSSKAKKTAGVFGAIGLYYGIKSYLDWRLANWLKDDDLYKVLIAQPHSNRYVVASVPDSFFFDITSVFTTLDAGPSQGQYSSQLEQTLAGLSGHTQYSSRFLNANKWENVSPYAIQIPLHIVPGSNPDKELVEPLQDMIAAILPTETLDGEIIAPGPRIKWKSGDYEDELDRIQQIEIDDNDFNPQSDVPGFLGGGKPDPIEEDPEAADLEKLSGLLQNNVVGNENFEVENGVHVIFGRHLHFYPMYISNVNQEVNMTYTRSGKDDAEDPYGNRPTEALVQVYIHSWVTPNTSDLNQLFQYNRKGKNFGQDQTDYFNHVVGRENG